MVRSWLRYGLARMEQAAPGSVSGELRKLAEGDASDLARALCLLGIPEKGPSLKAALQTLETAWKTREAKSATGRQLGRSYVLALLRGQAPRRCPGGKRHRPRRGLLRSSQVRAVMRALILKDAERADLLEREGKALLESSETREAGFMMLTFAATLRLDAAAYRDVSLQVAAADIERLGQPEQCGLVRPVPGEGGGGGSPACGAGAGAQG